MFFRDRHGTIWNLGSYMRVCPKGEPKSASIIEAVDGTKISSPIVQGLASGYARKFMSWLTAEIKSGKPLADVADFYAKYPELLPEVRSAD